MKRVWGIIAVISLIVFASLAISHEMYKINATISSIEASTPCTSLLRIPLTIEGGYLEHISCQSTSSDSYTVYLLDKQIAVWPNTNDSNDQTIQVFSYASSTTGFKDINIRPFSCDDTTYVDSLFLGIVNTDATYTANFSCDLIVVDEDYFGDLGTVSQ